MTPPDRGDPSDPPGPAQACDRPGPGLPRLRTVRLTLVPLSLAEAAAVLDGTWPGERGAGWPQPETFAALGAVLARDAAPTYCWLVRVRGTGAAEPAIGELGLKGAPSPAGEAEIGYSLARPWRGKGLGGEAVAALVGWAEQRPDLRRLRAEVHPDNLPSRRLLEALGFRLEEITDGQLWFARSVTGRPARA